MMSADQDPMRSSGSQIEIGHPKKRAIRQIERRLQSGASPFHRARLLILGQVGEVHSATRRKMSIVLVDGGPFAVFLTEAEAERIMTDEKLSNGTLEAGEINGLGRLQQGGDVPMMGIRRSSVI